MIHTRYPHRTQLRTISMILTFDNKFDQIDEAGCMFIFQIKHQYSFWIIAIYYSMHCYGFYTDFHDPVLVTLWHNFERHHNNLSRVNYLMTTVKIESIHSLTFTYPFVYNTYEIKTFPLCAISLHSEFLGLFNE